MAYLCSETFILFIISTFCFICFSSSTPFILLHGITESCNDIASTFYTSQLSRMSGAYGQCLEIGNGAFDSVTMPIENQVQVACEKVKGMNELRQGYNIVALSQGNIIARGIIELCDGAPPVKNFISIGGPNAGVANAVCAGGPWCAFGVYSDFGQSHYAPNGYVKLPNDIGGYLRGCRFLPKLNNEIPNAFNSTYKERFSSLQNLILIMFENDLIVTPKESSWFGFYQDGSYTQVLPPQQTNLYLNDLFGLQTLDKAGKIKFIKVPGFHLGMDIQELRQYVVPYLIDGGAPAPAPTPTVSPVVQFSFKKKLVINDTAIGKEKLVS